MRSSPSAHWLVLSQRCRQADAERCRQADAERCGQADAERCGQSWHCQRLTSKVSKLLKAELV